MSKHEEKEPAFKVVDKRGLNTESTQKEKSTQSLNEKTQEKPQEGAAAKAKGDTKELPKMNISIFVQSMAHQAMMGLGMTPWPDSGLIKKDENLARQSIDIIDMLKEKTKGNLTQDEQKLIDTLLYQLQVAFVNTLNKPEDPKGDNSIIK